MTTPWRTFTTKPAAKKRKQEIPRPVLDQQRLNSLYNYEYKLTNNGNVENNSTLYVNTGVAHASQVQGVFNDVIERAKRMPEVFGPDFECDVKINVVRRHNGDYMAYAFVDLSNPSLYYALIGLNTDGSERVEYVDDKHWVAPTPVKSTKMDWAEENEETLAVCAPKIRRELEPLITLSEFEYDEQQRLHLDTKETKGVLTASPAFISPEIEEQYDRHSLYVSEVPDDDYGFLYEIFARYARSSCGPREFYPKIFIKPRGRAGGDKGLFAIVQYAHPYDSSYALQMLQKVRAKYNGEDITMCVRHAFVNNSRKRR